MVTFKVKLEKFESKGEKSGWTYLPVSATMADKLSPGMHKSFRVKGKIDEVKIQQTALLPMGDGHFIMAINTDLRRKLKKIHGAEVEVRLEVDGSALKTHKGLLECLADEPAAKAFFNSMPPSHQHYYSRWIDSAKAESIRTKRIALAVTTMAMKLNYSEMIHWQREQDKKFNR